jgi:hypothetical protein
LHACPHLEIEEKVHVLATVVFKEFRKLATSAEILVHKDFFGYGGFAKPSSKQAFGAHHVEKTQPSLFVFCPQVLMMQLHVGWGKGGPQKKIHFWCQWGEGIKDHGERKSKNLVSLTS